MTTVEELIAELQKCPLDAEVNICVTNRDYGGSTWCSYEYMDLYSHFEYKEHFNMVYLGNI